MVESTMNAGLADYYFPDHLSLKPTLIALLMVKLANLPTLLSVYNYMAVSQFI